MRIADEPASPSTADLQGAAGHGPMTKFAIDTTDCVRVQVSGDLDLCTCSELRSELIRLIDQGTKHLILDMRGVQFMDSSGLVVLIHSRKRVAEVGGTFALMDPTAAVQKVLALTGLTKIFETHQTLNGQVVHTVSRTD
jgi:anti-sigma B factor antagonist